MRYTMPSFSSSIDKLYIIPKLALLLLSVLIPLTMTACTPKLDCEATFSNPLAVEFCKDGLSDGARHWSHEYSLTKSEHSDHFWDRNSDDHFADNTRICFEQPGSCTGLIDIELENAYKYSFEHESSRRLTAACYATSPQHCRELMPRWAKGLLVTGAIVAGGATLYLVGVGVCEAYAGVTAIQEALAEFGISATHAELLQMGAAGREALLATGYTAQQALAQGLAGDTAYLSTIAF